MLETFCLSISAILFGMWVSVIRKENPAPAWWRWGGRPLAIGGLVAVPFASLIPPGVVAVLILPFYMWTWGGTIWLLLRFVGLWGGGKGKGGTDEYRRGASVLGTDELAAFLKKRYGNPGRDDINLGGARVPAEIEPMHFLLAGGTGSGKSVALSAMMVAARARKQRAVVADFGGEFTKRFFSDGDLIFNPFDERGFSWSPLAEMRQSYDAGRVANSIIPEGSGEGAEWNGYARNILTCVLEAAFLDPTATNREIVRLLFMADQESMAELVAGTPAARMYQKGNERMLGSVLGIISRYTAPLRWLDPDAGRDAFSIRSWIEQDGHGWLFLTFTEGQLAELRPLLAAILDTAASAVLGLPPDSARRVWFFLDEFASLGRINSIEPLLTKARKNGGAAVLGIQSLSQLRDLYGREKAQTLLSCLSSVLVLRQSDAELAEYMSRFLGDQEILRTNQSGGSSSQGKTENWSQQIVKERVILPSQLKNLEPRLGVLDLAGDIPAAWVALPVIQLHGRAPALVEKQVIAINPARDQQQQPQQPEPRRDDPQPPGGDYYDLP